MKLKRTLITSLSTIAVSSAIVLPISFANGKNTSTLSQNKIFNIKSNTLYGFNENVTSNDINQYIKQNNGFKLPSVKKIESFAFKSFNKKFNFNDPLPIPIPASVEVIGDHAFYDSDITELTFEEGSKCHTIGKSAFAFCKKLEKIEIPKSLYIFEEGKGITERAFFGCKSLKTIDLTNITIEVPQSEAKLQWDSSAFRGSSSEGNILFNFDSQESSKYLIGFAWRKLVECGLNPSWKQCDSEGETISDPFLPIPTGFFKFDEEDVTKLIGCNENWLKGKYENKFNATIIPPETTSIEFDDEDDNFFIKYKSTLVKHSFAYCDKLKVFPPSIFKGIDNSNFTIIVPPNLEEIGEHAFDSASIHIKGLTEILAPGGSIKTIGARAFKHCSSPDIQDLTFNSNITVGDKAFTGMNNLKSINLAAYGKTPPETWAENCFESISSAKRVVTLVEDESKNPLEQWRLTKNWMPWFEAHDMTISEDEWTIKPDGSTIKYEDLFKVVDGECKGWLTDNSGNPPTKEEIREIFGERTTMTIPSHITKIGDNAFTRKDDQGKYVSTIPEQITTIDFSNSNVTSIGKNAFINLPETVTTLKLGGNKLINIDEQAFANGKFTSIENLEETTSLETIGNKAFYNCNKVSQCCVQDETTGILLNNLTKLTSIGNDAFSRWESLVGTKTLRLPKSLTSIGRNAFYANKFNTIEMPLFDNTITIGNNAFAQDTIVEEEKINCISMVEYVELTTDPPWVLNEGSYILAGVANTGKILLGSTAPPSQETRFKQYFAKQSEEIKRLDWKCQKIE